MAARQPSPSPGSSPGPMPGTSPAPAPTQVQAPCQQAWNGGQVPSDCESLASFNFTNGSYNPLESCPEPCQTYFTGVLENCSAGDTYDLSGWQTRYGEHHLWGEFHSQYPTCNLGYTATACDAAMNAARDARLGVCERSANSPCTAECAALFEAVRADCATGQATYVPIRNEQTWSVTNAMPYFSFFYDETCVAVLHEPVLTTCRTAFGQGMVPYDCPTAELDCTYDCPTAEPDCTSNPCTEIPLESCPEPCQAYFTGILDTCSVDDPLGPVPFIYPPTYAQYTVWDQFHSLYPACNLGPTPPACHRDWNRGRVPSDCESVASFNSTTGRYNPLESCPEPCQTHFTKVLESCSVGDTHQVHFPTWSQPSNLWDLFHDRYPMCNLGPVPGEDSSPGAVSNPDADSVPEADSSLGAGSNPDADSVPEADSSLGAGSNTDADSVPEAGPQRSESVRTVSGPGWFLLSITMVQAVAVVQCGS